jgi:replicative DNA helicase
MIDDREIEATKGALIQYVEAITKADPKAGPRKYICPLCGSGSHRGSQSTGAFSITPDGLSWKCFACGQTGDIYSLIGQVEHKDAFIDQFKRAAEFSGVKIPDSPQKQQKPEFNEKARAYVNKCRKEAHKTDYFEKRGFTPEIVERFGLGYDEKTKEIVVPYDRSCSYYITRSTTQKQFRKPPSSEAGEEPIYNVAALRQEKPCFVCESPLDAISIMAAGNGNCQAIALGGTGHRKLISHIEKAQPNCILVLSFDNDKPGENARDSTSEDLRAHKVPFVVATYNLDAYPKDCRKDANDYLRANPQQLATDIFANLDEIERKMNAEKAERLEAHNKRTGSARYVELAEQLKCGAGIPTVPTGFSELDRELEGGLHPGLYVLGALSSMGKTSFALQLADQIAQGGNDVLYFSLEMAASELIAKSLSRLTYLNCNGIQSNAKTATGILMANRYSGYSDIEKELIEAAGRVYGDFADCLYFYEGIGDLGVTQIRQAVEEHRTLTGKNPVVFVDYLQILAPIDVRASDKQNVDRQVLELKRISRDYNTSVFAISSLNRESYSSKITMSSFKESGALEYGSDVLFALQPQGMKEGFSQTEQKENASIIKNCRADQERLVELAVLKNRNGKTGGRVGFCYRPLFNIFTQDYQADSYTEIDNRFNVF